MLFSSYLYQYLLSFFFHQNTLVHFALEIKGRKRNIGTNKKQTAPHEKKLINLKTINILKIRKAINMLKKIQMPIIFLEYI